MLMEFIKYYVGIETSKSSSKGFVIIFFFLAKYLDILFHSEIAVNPFTDKRNKYLRVKYIKEINHW